MNAHDLIGVLEAAGATLPFGGPFGLTPIKDLVWRLDAGSGSYLLKWIAASDRNGQNEILVNRTLLPPGELGAPCMAMTVDAAGGTIAAWDWLAGEDLLVGHRDRVPEAFGALGTFHVRRRHQGPVVSPTSRQAHPSIPALLAAESNRLLPLVEPSLRQRCALCLARLEQGYATLIHGDVHPGNIISTDAGLHFVDWSSALPSLNFFDLEYVQNMGDPCEPAGPYMLPPESAAVLETYAAHCGIADVDIARVHLAVMLWRDLYYLESCFERPKRDAQREARFRHHVLQDLECVQEDS